MTVGYLEDRYVLGAEIGEGSMGRVYAAYDTVLGIDVAVKIMRSEHVSSPSRVARFTHEASIASRMLSPHIARVLAIAVTRDGIPCIVLELLQGETLAARIDREGTLSVAVTAEIVKQVARALTRVHALGLVHRDVKPENIFLTREPGTSYGLLVKLIDFGIAKASAQGMQTMSGTIKGKFGYMAPEYIGGSIDARADLFAIGVIAHELLTNRPLFSGPDDMATLQRVMKMDIAPPSRSNPQVPPEIDDIVMTALERDPEKRWQHATALRSALTTLTKRLGLVVHDSHVMEWLSWALEQTKPRTPSLRNMQVATPVRMNALATSDVVTPASELDGVTPILDGRPLAPQLLTPPTGTPPLAAQPRAESAAETMQVQEHQIAAEAYERDDALHPTGGRLVIDELVPTLVRAPSAPRVKRPSMPHPPQPDFSRPVQLAPPAPPRAKPTSPIVAVLLVLLAAAAAAVVVYFA